MTKKLTVSDSPDFYLSLKIDKKCYEKAKEALLKIGRDYSLRKED